MTIEIRKLNTVGPAGQDGRDGVDGLNGRDGTNILTGAKAPANDIGKDGDLYFQTNGLVFRKDAGKWRRIADITGPKGADGEQGPKGKDGKTGVVTQYISQGSPPASSGGDFETLTGSINPSETKVLDTFAFVDLSSVSYKTRLSNSAMTKTKSFDHFVNRVNTDLSDSIVAKLGNADVTVAALKTGSSFQLSITNNESDVLNYSIKKLLN